MDMDVIYYIILGITVVSYLLGLFLSHFERKGEVSMLSNIGNEGFINIFGVSSSRSKQELQFQHAAQMAEHPFQMHSVPTMTQSIEYSQPAQMVSVMDDEII